jgi:hypothetical protein
MEELRPFSMFLVSFQGGENKISDRCDTIVYVASMCLYRERRFFGWLIRCGHTGVVIDFSGPGEFVQPLDITLFTNLQGTVDIDFKEILFADNFPDLVAIIL